MRRAGARRRGSRRGVSDFADRARVVGTTEVSDGGSGEEQLARVTRVREGHEPTPGRARGSSPVRAVSTCPTAHHARGVERREKQGERRIARPLQHMADADPRPALGRASSLRSRTPEARLSASNSFPSLGSPPGSERSFIAAGAGTSGNPENDPDSAPREASAADPETPRCRRARASGACARLENAPAAGWPSEGWLRASDSYRRTAVGPVLGAGFVLGPASRRARRFRVDALARRDHRGATWSHGSASRRSPRARSGAGHRAARGPRSRVSARLEARACAVRERRTARCATGVVAPWYAWTPSVARRSRVLPSARGSGFEPTAVSRTFRHRVSRRGAVRCTRCRSGQPARARLELEVGEHRRE